MLFGTLGASLLGNLLTGKGIVRAGSGENKKGKGIVRASSGGNKKGKRIVRAGSGNKKGKGIVRAGSGRPLSSLLCKIKKNGIFNYTSSFSKLSFSKFLNTKVL